MLMEKEKYELYSDGSDLSRKVKNFLKRNNLEFFYYGNSGAENLPWIRSPHSPARYDGEVGFYRFKQSHQGFVTHPDDIKELKKEGIIK